MVSDLLRVKEQTDMQTMSREGNKLVHRWDGETLVVEPWGNNSLRVRSAVMREPEDTDYALLPQADTAVSITVGGGGSFTHLPAPQTGTHLVFRLLLLKKKKKNTA